MTYSPYVSLEIKPSLFFILLPPPPPNSLQHEACNHGHTALLTLLLDHEALINAPGFEHDSPLHDAVSNYRLGVVRFLRERGASLESRYRQDPVLKSLNDY